MIGTSSKIAREYLVIFGHIWKFSENDQKCSYELWNSLARIFENLRKMLGNLREIAIISLILLFI